MTILEKLKNEILTGDGAIGTMLYTKGVSRDSNFEHLNLIRPSVVLELTHEYVAAGAQVIETNTFGANRIKLETIGLAHKVNEINRAAVRIARQATAKTDVIVAGSIGPLAKTKGEERTLSDDEIETTYMEQATAMNEEGVDLFQLETFTSLPQLLIALKSVKSFGIPVLTSMAFMEGGRSADGTSVEQFCNAVENGGADIIGANCGAGPLELLNVIKLLTAITDKPISAYANSGFPELVDGRYLYRSTPEYLANMAHELANIGANLIGGCCGTTPEHIAAIAQILAGQKPTIRKRQHSTIISEPTVEKQSKQSSFLDQWGKRKIITVELDPPKGMDCTKIIDGSHLLKEAGVDALNLAENPLARPRMGNIALGSIIQNKVGIEVITHVTGRDRNLIGMQSDLMGASLLGIRSILAVTGDPATMGDHAGAKSVFDLHSFTLIKLLADLNLGVNAVGNSIGKGTGFTIGAAFNPNTANMALQVERLRKKVANGAQFAQSQPVYDPALFLQAAEMIKELQIPLFPGIMPLVSERNAQYLHNEVPGITVPDSIRNRMKGLEKEAGVREGLAIAKEFIDATINVAGGYYIIPPFGKCELALELIEYIKQLEKRYHD